MEFATKRSDCTHLVSGHDVKLSEKKNDGAGDVAQLGWEEELADTVWLGLTMRISETIS